MSRRRKWIIIAVVSLAGLIVLNEAIDLLVGAAAERRLEQRLNARVEFEGFDFGIFSGARADRVIIRPETGEGKFPADIRLSDVEIDHRVSELLAGKYRITRIGVDTIDARMIPGFLLWIAGLEGAGGIPEIPEIELKRGFADFDFPLLSHPLKIENLRLSVWKPEPRGVQGVVSFSSGKNAIRLKFEANPGEKYIETDVLVRGFDLSALPAIEKSNFSLYPAQLDVRGVLAGTIRAFFPDGPEQPPDVSGALTLSGFNVSHRDIPLHLTNGTARFDIANRAITLRDGAINFAGGNIAIPAAGLEFAASGIKQLWCRADFRDMEITSICQLGCFKAVPRPYRPAIHSGTADGGFNARWTPSGGTLYSADITLRDVYGAVEEKGIAISALDAEGSVDSSGRVKIHNASGRLFGGRAEAAGAFLVFGDKITDTHLECRFNDIAQDPVLIEMLPPHVRKAIEFTGIHGAEADGAIGIDPDGLRVDITVHAKTANSSSLPFRLDDAAATIKWASGERKVILDDFSASIDGSPVEGSATLLLEKPLRSDFILRGRYLPLTRELLEWLKVDLRKWEAGGSFNIAIQGENWRPSKESVVDSLQGLKARADLRDFHFSHPEYGKVAENMFGNLTLGKGGFRLSDLRGDLYGVGFRGSGKLPLGASRGGRSMQVETDNINLGPRLFDRLPKDFGIAELGVTGQCKLQAEITETDEKGGFNADVIAVLHRLEMTSATPLTATGTAQFRIGGDDLRSPWVEGGIDLTAFSVGPLEGDSLSTDFGFNHPNLSFKDIYVSAYGGKITSEQASLNVDTGAWESVAAISHLDFESLMGAYGVEGRDAPAGVMRGNLRLAGKGLDPETLAGGGEVKIDRGRLYSFPLLVTILSLFEFQLPSQSPVTDAYGAFQFRKGWIEVEDFLLTGGSVPIHVEGKIGLKKEIPMNRQKINFLVTVAKSEGLIDKIPVLDVVKAYTIDLLRRIVFQAEVKGTYGDHKIYTLSNPVVKPVQKMWQLIDKLTPSPPGRKR